MLHHHETPLSTNLSTQKSQALYLTYTDSSSLSPYSYFPPLNYNQSETNAQEILSLLRLKKPQSEIKLLRSADRDAQVLVAMLLLEVSAASMSARKSDVHIIF